VAYVDLCAVLCGAENATRLCLLNGSWEQRSNYADCRLIDIGSSAVCFLRSVAVLTLVSVAHWHSARSAWNGYQPGLGSIPRPGRI